MYITFNLMKSKKALSLISAGQNGRKNMLNGFPDNFRMDEDEVLNEFRRKQANFDLEEKQNEINNSRSLFIGALAGLAMAAVVGWFVLAPEYDGGSVEEVPLIRRPQEEAKVPPADPGSVAISNREQTVYDIIEHKMEQPEEPNVLPPAEQPNADAIEALVEEVSARKETAEPTAKPKAAAKAPAKAAAPVAKGSWQIQLMSSPNRQAVEKSWASLSAKYKMLSGLAHEISSADLGSKGTYYRLKAGNFATREEAAAFCNRVKAAGGSCFVARK